MNWFYAIGGQQHGPVDDGQLDALIAASTVNPETLVWREGLANWQPLRQRSEERRVGKECRL